AALDWVDLDRYLPLRVEILDFYHVLERVAEIAHVLHADDPTAAVGWRLAQKKELLEVGPGGLLRQLKECESESSAVQELRRVQLAYFQRQQELMRYPEYLRREWPIGSGAVEGACKHVVAARLDRGGMRWKIPTAEPVMRLRAAL